MLQDKFINSKIGQSPPLKNTTSESILSKRSPLLEQQEIQLMLEIESIEMQCALSQRGEGKVLLQQQLQELRHKFNQLIQYRG